MRKIIIGLAIFILSLGIIAGGLYFWYRTGNLQKTIVNEVVKKEITSNPAEMSAIQEVLGFSQPRTYLLLFLNNTELRPGGGFIGEYAVIQVDKGIPHILKVEGTELLDNYAPQDVLPAPPAPLAEYVGVKKWGFRDSNWSPDFPSSSVESMKLFRAENGTSANQIDSVIGFTPTVLEEILKITGPITVDGKEYNSENFTQQLEYEVEFGYAQQGLDFNQRKKVLSDLTSAMLSKIQGDVFKNWNAYFGLIQEMLAQKQIVAYSSYPEAENILLAKGWAGEIKQTAGDYILWVDANMAALKTDKVVTRTLSYSIAPTSSDRFVGTLKMDYQNNGTFSQFTTRYRTYARIYVPIGSRFISVSGDIKSSPTSTIDQGIENDKQWFGAFTSIEPGKTGELKWQFYLAPEIAAQIKNNSYSLLAQKQIGTIASGLTLDLDFGKPILSATPGELPANYGDNKYMFQTDLRVDKDFQIKLKE
jgi:hypothetical protein